MVILMTNIEVRVEAQFIATLFFCGGGEYRPSKIHHSLCLSLYHNSHAGQLRVYLFLQETPRIKRWMHMQAHTVFTRKAQQHLTQKWPSADRESEEINKCGSREHVTPRQGRVRANVWQRSTCVSHCRLFTMLRESVCGWEEGEGSGGERGSGAEKRWRSKILTPVEPG